MEIALDEARAAATRGETPVGAAIVAADGARVLARAGNRTRETADPTAHAEILAIRAACAAAGSERLPGATLYVTLEPCAMCAGALVLAKVERLVYAAADPKTGMCGSLGCIVQDPRLNHRLDMTAGVLSAEAGALLREFFRARRGTRG
jgi:cytidine deaminase